MAGTSRRVFGKVSILALASFALIAVGTPPARRAHDRLPGTGQLVFSSDRADIPGLAELLRGPPPAASAASTAAGATSTAAAATSTAATEPSPVGALRMEPPADQSTGSLLSQLASWPVPAPDTRIAFATHRDLNPYNTEIYVMNADGSNLVQLTHNTVIDGDPDWSPDGQKIVFTSSLEGQSHLWVMNADGTDLHRVSQGSALEAFAPGRPTARRSPS